MSKKKGIKQTYFIDDMEVISLSYNPSSSGTIVALRNKQGIDFHLTIYKRDLSLISHVVYKNKKTGEEFRTSDKEFKLEDFVEHLRTELGEELIINCDNQDLCYTFTDKYIELMFGKTDEKGNQEVNVMNAIQANSSNLDLFDTERFRVVSISQLPKTYPLGFIMIEEEIKIIIPISKDKILVLPENFIEKTFSLINEGLGFNTFIEELSERVSKE